MQSLQAIQTGMLLVAIVAVVLVVTRVVADAWRAREADGQDLAAHMLGRAIRRQNERGEKVEPALQQRFTALQVKERRPPTARQNLDLRLAPVFFVGAVLLQWVVGRLMGQSISLWSLGGWCVARHRCRDLRGSPAAAAQGRSESQGRHSGCFRRTPGDFVSPHPWRKLTGIGLSPRQ